MGWETPEDEPWSARGHSELRGGPAAHWVLTLQAPFCFESGNPGLWPQRCCFLPGPVSPGLGFPTSRVHTALPSAPVGRGCPTQGWAA